MAITKTQFKALDDLFTYYNRTLFQKSLPECIVSVARAKRFRGYFSPARWKERGSKNPIHEIVLNSNSLGRDEKEWHSTLVHEMCHLWCEVYGKPAKWGYHTRHWAARMKEAGLQPSDTRQPGGKETGRKVGHYIIKGGAFEKAYKAISAKTKLPFTVFQEPKKQNVSLKPRSRSGVKETYSCPCGNKAWGKAGLHLICGACGEEFSVLMK